MPKLRLKETPEERAERRWRKAQRAERKARRKSSLHARAHDDSEAPPPRKRPRAEDGDERPWVPPETSVKIDPEQVRAEVEERVFRQKMFDAMHDDYDHRLDGLEADFNDYGHVPHRWKTAGAEGQSLFDHPTVNPNEMADEEYAEWIREGMWRRTHKAEMEERERKKAAREAQKEQERKAKEETARLERERETERRAKREIKEKRRLREAWGFYETRWKAQTSGETQDARLKFRDIPWPIFSVPRTPEDLTSDRISAFLLHEMDGRDAESPQSKTRKERIREAQLRWHPDKFEGKMGSRLDIHERNMVMEGVGIVARCLNEMMTA